MSSGFIFLGEFRENIFKTLLPLTRAARKWLLLYYGFYRGGPLGPSISTETGRPTRMVSAPRQVTSGWGMRLSINSQTRCVTFHTITFVVLNRIKDFIGTSKLTGQHLYRCRQSRMVAKLLV